MSDLIGKTLGPYRILEQIGVGGMATVYKAYQPSMDRDVAIKILPHYLSEDRQFAERFQREAHAIAKLEHAHILPVYDYGECDGVPYIAMRYVHAGTLKDRMAKGPLPLEEINRLIGQIGSALDYAHSQGVIHRDVKPSNALIDDQGNTYLADFGLARMLEASQRLTASGVGIGTPAYMSPEQGQGFKVDHRSDIYSLGVVLYEMITGRVPYEAETPMAVVLKHITEPLPLPRTIAPNVPEVVEKVILRAMAKDPAHRFQSACDMVQALNLAARKVSPPEPAQSTVRVAETMPTREHIPLVTRIQQMQMKPRGEVALVVGAIVVLVVLGSLFSLLLGRVQIAAPGATATTVIGQATIPAHATAEAATPTPIRPMATAMPFPVPVPATEGKWLIQCENVKPIQICVEDVSTRQITPVTHDLNFGIVGSFSWSPDGRQIAFSAAETDTAPVKLYIINADGTDLRLIKSGNEPAWSPDAQWIAFQREDGLWLIRPGGSDARRVLANKPDQLFYPGMPAWSPDSQRLSLLNFSKAGTEVWVVNADGSELRMIYASGQTFDGGYVSWSPDGQRIHWKRGKGGVSSDLIVPVDGKGEPQALASFPVPDWWSTAFWPQWGGEAQAPTAPCRVAYEQGGDVYVRNCDGSGVRRISTLGTSELSAASPAWSPSGELIVFGFGPRLEYPPLPGAYSNLYIIRADGTGLTQLTSGNSIDQMPAWSPDGRLIAFHRNCNLMTIAPDGTDLKRVLTGTDEVCVGHPVWSPNGRQLAFENSWPEPPGDSETIYVINADGTGLLELARFDAKWAIPAWSPDSQQVGVQVRGHDGADRYYLLNADGSGAPVDVASIPDSWYPWYWPQWGSEAGTSAAPCRVAYVEKTGANTVDIFVKDCDGSNRRRVTEGRISTGHEPAWSPDGQRLVFDEMQAPYDPEAYVPTYLYLVNADGSNLTPIISPDGPVEGNFPVWSPDGTRIAWQGGCEIMTIHPDGSDMVTVLAHRELSGAGDPEMCVHRPMWSPDSQRFAFATFPLEAAWDPSIPGPYEYRFYVVNADGTGLTRLASFKLAYSRLEGGASGMSVAWLPDGHQLAFEVTEGDKTRRYQMNADGPGEMVEIVSIPDSWYPWHWPQWGGEAQPALGLQAEQARAFAEPILQAIANRQPDFVDDFSAAGKGWAGGNLDHNESVVVQNGVARLEVKEKDVSFGNEALNRKDFVLQVDARVAEGDKATQLIVNFHNLSGEYWFYVVVNSAGNTWLVDKRLAGQQPNLANSSGNVSPFGEATRIMIVARGPRAAIYLNDTPVAYFEDADFDTSGGTGLFCQSLGQAVCEFDNVKFWNLANVPGLP